MKLVLLDRDGVLNEDLETSVRSLSQFKMIDGVAGAIKRLNNAGLKVAVVTNQAVVGRGDLSVEELDKIHESLCTSVKAEGGNIDKIYVCTSTDEDNDIRRKPGPGMLQEAMQDFKVQPEDTIMLGDALRDLQAAKAAGCKRALVLTGKGVKTFSDGIPNEIKPFQVFKTLGDAVCAIVAGAV